MCLTVCSYSVPLTLSLTGVYSLYCVSGPLHCAVCQDPFRSFTHPTEQATDCDGPEGCPMLSARAFLAHLIEQGYVDEEYLDKSWDKCYCEKCYRSKNHTIKNDGPTAYSTLTHSLTHSLAHTLTHSHLFSNSLTLSHTESCTQPHSRLHTTTVFPQPILHDTKVLHSLAAILQVRGSERLGSIWLETASTRDFKVTQCVQEMERIFSWRKERDGVTGAAVCVSRQSHCW